MTITKPDIDQIQVSVSVATWQQCSQEELSSSGRGLAGRFQANLLRENQQQPGRPRRPQ